MQTLRRGNFLISAFLISTILVSISTIAAISQVTLQPTQTSPDKYTWFTISVKNLGGNNINNVEIAVPQQGDSPVYTIKEFGDPAGWTHELRYSVGAASPFKIVWSTSGSGIESGKSLQFNFNAKAPIGGGDYPFDWSTSDLNGNKDSGPTKITNLNIVPASFGVTAPAKVTAGKEFEITMTALDQNGNKKADYAEKIKFTSSDAMSVLPVDYTFKDTDGGAKAFRIKFKTVGQQEVKISDGQIEKKLMFNVTQGDIASIHLNLDKDTVSAGATVAMSVESYDIYGNTNDVTKNSKFEIDRQAKGIVTGNTYNAEVEGKWTIMVSYISSGRLLIAGAPLTVSSSAVTQPIIQPPQKSEIVETMPKVSIEMTTEKSIEVPSNSTKSFEIKVKNTGEKDLKGVAIYFTGYSEKLVSIIPSSANIAKGGSQNYQVEIFGSNETTSSNLEFVALSTEYPSDKLNASSIVVVNVVAQAPSIEQISSQTGKVALNKNFTYLGIAIVVAVVLIILFWALFLKEDDRGKKPE